MRGGAGQAQLELIGAIPVLLIVAAVLLQLMAVGHTRSLADGAVEAGALAVAGGLDSGEPERATLAALPAWARERARVAVAGGEVELWVRPPALIPGIGAALEQSARAWAREPR